MMDSVYCFVCCKATKQKKVQLTQLAEQALSAKALLIGKMQLDYIPSMKHQIFTEDALIPLKAMLMYVKCFPLNISNKEENIEIIWYK